MNRDDDSLLRDELTRRFDLVLRPSAGEIERFRAEAARLVSALGDLRSAELEAARCVFLMPVEMQAASASSSLRSAA